MRDYSVPVFADLQELTEHKAARSYAPNTHGGPQRTVSSRVAADIRWDYEHGLMRLADLKRKWAAHASAGTVQGIAYGVTYREVNAQQWDGGNVK